MAVALLVPLACDTGETVPPLPVEVRVGLVFAGGDRISQKEAVELALREREERAVSPRIVPLFKETASAPESARKAFGDLIGKEGVHVILGPTWSSEARLAHPIAQAAGVPVLAISNIAGGITDAGDYIFRISLSEGEVIPETVKIADEELNLAQVSLVYDPGDLFSKAVADVFRAEIERRGLRIVGEHQLSNNTSSAGEIALTVAAEGPDAVIVSALQVQAWGVLQEIRKVSSVYVIGGSVFASPEMMREYQGAANNLVFGVPWHSLSGELQSREFVEEYRSAYSTEPDVQAAQAYAGMVLLDAALERVELEGKSLGESRTSIRDGLKSVGTVPTVLGTLSFTDKRNPKHPPSIMIARGGKLEELSDK
jgi:branched-chain amino acid transport system substrate-binding protein